MMRCASLPIKDSTASTEDEHVNLPLPTPDAGSGTHQTGVVELSDIFVKA